MDNNVTAWDLQFASGFYLVSELPTELLDKFCEHPDSAEGEDEILSFIEGNEWLPLEGADSEYIWEHIQVCARSIKNSYTRRVNERGSD